MQLLTTGLAAIKGSGLGTILSGAGSAVSALGAIQAGRAADASAKFQAKQLEQRAQQEEALAQREANEQRRQAQFLQSRARAVGAASGGGVDYGLLGDIEEEGEYRALMAMWGGDERAAGQRMQASAQRLEGKSMRTAGGTKAFTTLLSTGGSLLEKYG